MTDHSIEERLELELNDMFHAAMINDAGIRKLFIDTMTGAIDGNDLTDAEMHSIYQFIEAVDYMLGTLGLGICDLEDEDEPVHPNETPD